MNQLPFNPRRYQLPFLSAMQGGCRLAVCVWHRRAGKDVCAWWWTIVQAMQKTGTYFYTFPTYAQAKKVIWDGMISGGRQFRHLIPEEVRLDKRYKENETELQITLPPIAGGSNGSIIQLVGLDKIDYVMGTNPEGIVYSEYAIQNPEGRKFLRPIVIANKGWEVFVFTPRGPNHGEDVWKEAGREPAFRQMLNIEQTADNDGNPIIAVAEIEKMRADGVDEDFIQQEYYCSFSGSQQGSYYGALIRKAIAAGRIGRVPYDPKLPVHTTWDIGHGDDTVIGFWQQFMRDRRLIDCYIAQGEGLEHYAGVLSERARLEGYRYNWHVLPHDAEAHSPQTGITYRKYAENLKIRPTLVAPKLSIQEGITAVRGMLPTLWIDEVKCAPIVKALTQYHKEYDEETKQYSEKPVHDQYSHPADMVRYEAVSNVPGDDDYEKPKQAFQDFDPLSYSAEEQEDPWLEALV